MEISRFKLEHLPSTSCRWRRDVVSSKPVLGLRETDARERWSRSGEDSIGCNCGWGVSLWEEGSWEVRT